MLVCSVCDKPTRSRYGICRKHAEYDHHLKYDERVSNYALFVWRQARTRAKRKGVEFSITVDMIEIPETCPILGMPLVVHQGKASYDSPSLDRIDNSKGYVPGNIQVISNRANLMKHDASQAELLAFATYYVRKLS